MISLILRAAFRWNIFGVLLMAKAFCNIAQKVGNQQTVVINTVQNNFSANVGETEKTFLRRFYMLAPG